MVGFGFWPVAAQPVGEVACGTLLWRAAGRLHVTVAVKGTFQLVPDGVVRSAAAERLSPEQGELAPYLGRADVVLTAAHAYACPPAPVTAVAVRVALIREWPILDKRLLVYGAQARLGASRALFTEAIVVRAAGSSGALGLLLNPADPKRPVGFGMLAPEEPERVAVLEACAPLRLVGDVLEIPDAFAWDYFQVAPVDQRTGYLRGDEWVVLDGFHPVHPRVKSQLSGASALVWVYPPSRAVAEGPTFQVAMQADRLNIDADRMLCSVVWRGSFPVADEASARALTLLCALASPGQPRALPQQGVPIQMPLSLEPAAPEPAAEMAPASALCPGEEPDGATAQFEREDRPAPRVDEPAAPATGSPVPSGPAPTAEAVGPAANAPDAALARMAEWMAKWMDDDGSTTLRTEPGPTAAPADSVTAGPSERLVDPVPKTERLGTSAPAALQLRPPNPDRFETEPASPLGVKKTVVYFGAPGGAASWSVGLGGQEPPAAQPAPEESPATTRLDLPAEPSGEPEARAIPAEVPSPTVGGGPILPSRAELPMYLPCEAKRWARASVPARAAAPSDGAEAGSDIRPRLELDEEGAVSVRFLESVAERRQPSLQAEEEAEPPTAALARSSRPGGQGGPGAGSPSRPLPLGRSRIPLPDQPSAAAWDGSKAFGAPVHVLKPQAIPGAPWTRPSPAQSAAQPTTGPLSAADLPLVSVADLESTLGETLSARDPDVEIFEEDTHVSGDFRRGSSDGGGGLGRAGD